MLYGCHGEMKGFEVETEPGQRRRLSCGPHLCDLVHRACREQTWLSMCLEDDGTTEVTIVEIAVLASKGQRKTSARSGRRGAGGGL